MMRIKHYLILILNVAIFSPSLSAQTTTEEIIDAQGGSENICAYMLELAEDASKFPKGLLQSIAQVESGRYTPGFPLRAPWPWTVSSADAKERSKFFPTRQEALDSITQLQNQGITNIDVGCMQVNLFYHGRGFSSLEEAIDPINNIAYATEFLNLLYNRYGNWGDAIKHYHSSDPEKNSYYLQKVIAAWRRNNTLPSDTIFRDLQAALNDGSEPPTPPSEESERNLAKNTLEFASDLRRKLTALEDDGDVENQRTHVEELRIWDQWQTTSNLGNIKGQDPDYYIELLDDTFK